MAYGLKMFILNWGFTKSGIENNNAMSVFNMQWIGVMDTNINLINYNYLGMPFF